jgi:protein gp37
MNETKIEWADYTWNPVTGCLHGCEYCYAKNQCHRFAKRSRLIVGKKCETNDTHELCEPYYCQNKNGKECIVPYPYGFDPTFHAYKLHRPQKVKKPQNVFVCSMADLFGSWIPDEWIAAVFEACEKAPWHNYMFLTKNPKRYLTTLAAEEPNYWLGATVTNQAEYNVWANFFDGIKFHQHYKNLFLSIEPMRGEITKGGVQSFEEKILEQKIASWIIVGAESGNRIDKVIPKIEWLERLASFFFLTKTPLLMKNSLAPIWGEELIQELPEGLRHD